MSELWAVYWPVVLIAIAIGLITGFLIFRPKQRVTLTRDSAPVRPHMAAPAPAAAPVPARRMRDGEGEGLASEAAAAVSDVTGQIIGAPVHSNLPGSQGVPDDLQRMKGVGPKLAEALHERGFLRFEQLAHLTPEEVERLDAQLGAFNGRLQRDRIVDQADYLARGDQDGFEQRFGKL